MKIRIALYIQMALAGALIATMLFYMASEDIDRRNTATVTCWEDQPCWNCETMGNKLCGPTTTAR